MSKLITQVSPEQFISYGALKIAFFDKANPDYNPIFHDETSAEFNPAFKDFPKYLTYIKILNGDDDRSVVIRAAGSRKIPDGKGGLRSIPEFECYKKAYDAYLKLKSEVSSEDSEIEKLKAEIALLKGKSESASEEIIEVVAPKKSSKKQVKEDVVTNLSE